MGYTVYKIVYIPTGKICYIGSTGKTLKERYHGHCKDRRRPMYSIIKAHDKKNFAMIAIDTAETQKDIFEKEKFWTEFWRSRTSLYNIDNGKDRAEIVKERLSAIGHTKVGSKNSFYGHKHSKESKMKMRMAKMGKKGNRNRPVICVTTGVKYGSLLEAAKSISKSPSAIGMCCRGIHNSCAGMKWVYA